MNIIQWRTGVEVRHVVIEPTRKVRNIGVNSKGILISTSISPADNTYRKIRVMVSFCQFMKGLVTSG